MLRYFSNWLGKTHMQKDVNPLTEKVRTGKFPPLDGTYRKSSKSQAWPRSNCVAVSRDGEQILLKHSTDEAGNTVVKFT